MENIQYACLINRKYSDIKGHHPIKGVQSGVIEMSTVIEMGLIALFSAVNAALIGAVVLMTAVEWGVF